MSYPSEAVDTISKSQTFSLLSVIDIWAHAMPIAKRNLLSQQHLVVLKCQLTIPISSIINV
eukprot:3217465-Ditylum_brightwellii.AAC.1